MRRFIIWSKDKKREILAVVIILLLVLLSFAIGYISGRDFVNIPIVIEKCSK